MVVGDRLPSEAVLLPPPRPSVLRHGALRRFCVLGRCVVPAPRGAASVLRHGVLRCVVPAPRGAGTGRATVPGVFTSHAYPLAAARSPTVRSTGDRERGPAGGFGDRARERLEGDGTRGRRGNMSAGLAVRPHVGRPRRTTSLRGGGRRAIGAYPGALWVSDARGCNRDVPIATACTKTPARTPQPRLSKQKCLIAAAPASPRLDPTCGRRHRWQARSPEHVRRIAASHRVGRWCCGARWPSGCWWWSR